MTRSAWVLLGLICGLIFLGLLTLRGGVILFALPLVVYLMAAVLAAPGELHLRVARQIQPEFASQGKPVSVKVEVVNEGQQVAELFLEDHLAFPLQLIDGVRSQRLAFAAGREAQLEYTLRGRRGSYLFQDLQAVACDDFGLFQLRAVFPAPARLLILPEGEWLQQIPVRPPATRGFAGPIPARAAGAGIDFYGVREYQVGDPYRKINWRVSARHDRDLYTNEFEQERIADIGLILDARQQNDLRVKQVSMFEFSVLATASLAEAFLRDGHRVGLLVYGYGLDWVFPGYGKVQRKRILHALARARTGENYAMRSLNYLPVRLFPARSQLVMISPLSDSDPPGYQRLRSQGYEILVVSPDPVSFEMRGYRDGQDLEFARRLAQIERQLLLRQIRRLGVRIVDWQVERSLDQILHSALARQPLNLPGRRG